MYTYLSNRIISVEGCDRAGKTTLVAKLANYINSKHAYDVVKVIKFPTITAPPVPLPPPGIPNLSLNIFDINQIFFEDRLKTQNEIFEWLSISDENCIIFDRYVHSGIVYNTATSSATKEYDQEAASLLEQGIRKESVLLQPQIIIYLNGSPDVFSTRSGYGDGLYEILSLQKFIAKCYDFIIKLDSPHKWNIINAEQTKEEVFNDAVSIISKARQYN
jgi:thymidylate kinase